MKLLNALYREVKNAIMMLLENKNIIFNSINIIFVIVNLSLSTLIILSKYYALNIISNITRAHVFSIHLTAS